MATLFAFASLLLLSCGHVKIKDWEDCAIAGKHGAACFNELSGNSRDLDKPTWDHESIGWVCTSPDSFAEKQAASETLCQNSELCDYETKKSLKAYSKRANRAMNHARNLSGEFTEVFSEEEPNSLGDE